MALDPSIITGIRPVQIDSPVNALAQVLKVQSMQQDAQLGQTKLDEYQRSKTRQNKLLDLVQALPVGTTDTQRVDALKGGGYFDEADKLQSGMLNRQKIESEAKAKEWETQSKKLDFAGQAFNMVRQNPTLENAHQVLDYLGQNGIYSPETVAQYKAAVAADPTKIASLADTAFRTVLGAKEQLMKVDTRNLGGTTQTIGVDPVTGKATVLNSAVNTQSPDSIATNQRIAAEGVANRANAIKVTQMVSDRQDAADAGTTAFTPGAIDNAAARYNFDGTLPPMGMGKSGSAGRSAILNRAAELKAGVDPAQQRADQLNNKNEVAAQGSAIRSFATGKDGQAVQSANTALNHLETIQNLAAAQKSGNVQAFNKAARSLGAQLGQAAPTNLSAALVMVAPEISKAVIGAGGTGHERDQAIQALNPNGSPDQILGATQTMQELFGGRLTEAKRTYERTTKKTDFSGTMLSPAAQRVLDRAHGAAAPAAAGVPADIAALLQKHGGK